MDGFWATIGDLAFPRWCAGCSVWDEYLCEHCREDFGPGFRRVDARAPYLLGNYLYHGRDADRAIALWAHAREIDPKFPTVNRNLGLAYFNKRQDGGAALQAFETAFALDPSDARVFFELDQLRRRLGQSPKSRLDRLVERLDLVEARDDLAGLYACAHAHCLQG